MLASAFDPTEYDLWSSPRTHGRRSAVMVVVAAISAFSGLYMLRFTGAGAAALFVLVATVLSGVTFLAHAIYNLRLALIPPTLLFGVRPDGLIVHANGITELVPYRFVKGARRVVGEHTDGSMIDFHRDAPTIVRASLPMGMKRFVDMPSRERAERYNDYVNARVAEAASTPNIRATSAS